MGDRDIHRTRPAALNTNYKYEQFWEEMRVSGDKPDRRSYHTAVEWSNDLYVFGGQDLREGAFCDLWVLRLDRDNHGSSHDTWEKLGIDEYAPKELCRHSAVVNSNRMYIFGGTNNFTENNKIHCYDMMSKEWIQYPAESPDLPPAIDSHTAVVYNDAEGSPCMLVFGGYIRGLRSNQCFSFNINAKKWTKIEAQGTPPCPRTDHTAIVYQNAMYVLDGTSDRDRISDFWKLDLGSMTWSKVMEAGTIPHGRSGHTAVIFNDLMILFGGIGEITRESNEMYSYNFQNSQWAQIQYTHQIQDPVSAVQLEEFKFRGSLKKGGRADRSPTLASQEPLTPGETLGSNVIRKKRPLYDGPASPEVGRVKGQLPHARDGHTATIVDGSMIVFGGDRHQMPFNDIYSYRLDEEIVRTPIDT